MIKQIKICGHQWNTTDARDTSVGGLLMIEISCQYGTAQRHRHTIMSGSILPREGGATIKDMRKTS